MALNDEKVSIKNFVYHYSLKKKKKNKTPYCKNSKKC